MRRSLPWLLVLLSLLAACAGDPAVRPHPPAPLPAGNSAASAGAKNSFALGVGDSVNISVWRFDDLKRTVLIDPAGKIQYPFVGEMTVAGLTMEQLRQELETRLARYYVNPRVDISVNQVRSQVVHVLGEVRNPGTVNIEKSLLAVEAIARSGGFTTDANEDAVLLIRDRDPQPQIFALALDFRRGDTSRDRNVPLMNNDIIFVAPAKIVDVTRFLNQVVNAINPFVSLGRSTLIADQVYRVIRGTSGGVLVAP